MIICCDGLTVSLNILLLHLFNIFGFVLAIVLIVRLLQEHHNPGSTLAWLMAIAFIPYIGVPLYLVFGGRKLRKVQAQAKHLSMGVPLPLQLKTDRPMEKMLLASGAMPSSLGNEVSMLDNGEATYQAIMQIIAEAKKSVYVTTFILTKDKVGEAIVDLLATKAREGVRVCLLLDALGCLRARGRFVAPIRKAGGQVGIFMPILPIYRKWSANLRNHRKMILVDGEQAIVGGMNLASEYLGPTYDPKRWVDFALLLKGPVYQDLEKIFASDWSYATGKELPLISKDRLPDNHAHSASDRGQLQVVSGGPDVARDAIYEALIFSILRAKQRIWVVTPYFVPDLMLFRALLLQARMGHDVQLVVPARSNHRVTDLARGYYLRELEKEGVKIHAYHPRMLHSKLMLIDDSLATVGSANFDMRSHYYNYEISVFMHSPHEINAIEAHINVLKKDCRHLPVPTTRFRASFNAWVENLTRLFAPLL